MTPHETADGQYKYNQMTPDGKTLFYHANNLNRYLSNIYKWNENRIRHGSWGTDINVYRIGYALKNTTIHSSMTDIAIAVHEGWILCYKFWINSKPWANKASQYYLPYGTDLTLNDKLLRSSQSFDELSLPQQQLCIDMAQYIKHECYKSVTT